jgi:arylsulfatase A-like enzyme
MRAALPSLVALGCLAVLHMAGSEPIAAAQADAAVRPNILWITCEDISPNLGCYGDAYAVTPHLDRFAAQAVRYTHAFAPIGVCAPARSCIITGMYPPSIGTHHMRCTGQLPSGVQCFPYYLRQAGYYCTNNVKTDYNFAAPRGTWDESSNQAHWRNRQPGQPFFAVFNFTSCHESQIRLPEAQYRQRTRDFTDSQRHDPARAPIPPYHPDTPEVRRDWARYADMITYMDMQVGQLLQELEADGLADETIVFFYSDHGAGMPRSKRWLYDSSLRVPFMVRFPEKYRDWAPAPAGSTTDRLVSFVDLAPTVLSLAGVEIPRHMQGVAFLGSKSAPARQYVYGFRDRMDERYDMLRAVRDKRYKYIRNYMPHLPWFHHQYISYMYEMPTMQVWQRLADEGKLSGPTAVFMAHSKPTEELYDTEADPHEVHNLADSPQHRDILQRMRDELRRWMVEIVDLGLLPEGDLRTRFGNTPAYDAVRQNPEAYPLPTLMQTAHLATARDPALRPRLLRAAGASDPAVRYWAVLGLGLLDSPDDATLAQVRNALQDQAAWVRVAAADALCRQGCYDEAVPTLAAAMEDRNEWVRLQAINVLDRIDGHARPALPAVRKALQDANGYVVRVAQHAVEAFASAE